MLLLLSRTRVFMMKDNTDSGDGAETGNIYISSEHIIQEVQKFRCLYDPSDPDHKDRDVVRDAWLTVTQAVVGEPWANLNTAEKNEAAVDVENRWRNVRDLIREALKNSRKNRPGLFYDELNPEANNSRSLSENENSQENAVAEVTEEQTETSSRPRRTLRPKRNPSVIDYLDEAIYDDAELSETSDSFPTIHTPPPKRKRNRPQQIIRTTQANNNNFGREQQPSNFAPYNTGAMPDYNSYPPPNYPCPPSVPEPENPDRMFLLSLLPRISVLNSRNKLDFQIKAMQLLRGLEKDS